MTGKVVCKRCVYLRRSVDAVVGELFGCDHPNVRPLNRRDPVTGRVWFYVEDPLAGATGWSSSRFASYADPRKVNQDGDCELFTRKPWWRP